MHPEDLAQVLSALPGIDDPRVLVGTSTSDDAAVYVLNHETALVQSLDFFTPLVDDPYSFGQVAAANALSDLYAMGARPLLALNIVAFPTRKLPLETLGDILRGGSDKVREAGIFVAGGHSIDDPEPKYGLVVSGSVHPDHLVRNVGAQPGDVLVLTKPLGTGIFTTALKRDLLPSEREQDIVRLMASLNRDASEAMQAHRPHACTDVTGYGLLAHLHSMLKGSGVRAEIDVASIPFVSEVLDLAAKGCVPGGSRANLRFCDPFVAWNDLPEAERFVLADAQTSGGLLIALAEAQAQGLLETLAQRGTPAHVVIGRVLEAEPSRVGEITLGGRLQRAVAL